MELFLPWSPVACWAPTNLGSSPFRVLSFCLFILFMGFSRQEYGKGLSFPSLLDHILSEVATMTCPSWVALHGMAHSFIELDKAVIHVIGLVSFLWLWFSIWSHGPQPCLTQWNYEPCYVGSLKMHGSWWRVLTKCGPLEKEMESHSSILTWRTQRTVWKSKKIWYRKVSPQGKRCPICCWGRAEGN